MLVSLCIVASNEWHRLMPIGLSNAFLLRLFMFWPHSASCLIRPLLTQHSLFESCQYGPSRLHVFVRLPARDLDVFVLIGVYSRCVVTFV